MERLAVDDEAWAAFVRASPDATPFHDPAWAAVLAEAYRMPVFALVERGADGRIAAGVPAAIPPRLPGRPRRLVALPFTDALAPLRSPDADLDLVVRLDELRREEGFAELELRTAAPGAGAVDRVGYRHTLALERDVDAVRRRLSQSRRRNVRLAERRGVVVRRGSVEHDLTETFFRLHVDTRRRLGVPVQPKRFFRLLWQRVLAPGHGFVLVAEQQGDPIAASVFLTGNDRLVYKFGASDERRVADFPNDLVLWTAIRDGCERGLESLDFGRTDLHHESLREYKRRFGADELPLDYTTLGRETPVERVETPHAAAGLLRRAPRLATRLAGELLYRYAG